MHGGWGGNAGFQQWPFSVIFTWNSMSVALNVSCVHHLGYIRSNLWYESGFLALTWSSSGAALLSHYESTLSQVGTHPALTIDVARMQNASK